jgi:hypothetical protein
MKVTGPLLVFGGPYSNLEATKAMLAEARRRAIAPGNIVCTGDLVAYCARPVRNSNDLPSRARGKTKWPPARKPHCPRRVRICASLVADEVEALLLNTRTTQHSLPISKVGLVKLIADRCRGC